MGPTLCQNQTFRRSTLSGRAFKVNKHVTQILGLMTNNEKVKKHISQQKIQQTNIHFPFTQNKLKYSIQILSVSGDEFLGLTFLNVETQIETVPRRPLKLPRKTGNCSIDRFEPDGPGVSDASEI